jgi:serine/threonine protein kinase
MPILRVLNLPIAVSKPLTMYRTIVTQAPLLEEQKLKHYKYGLYYPIHIGQNLHSRYGVEVKLGYGGYSTVWLCRDKLYVIRYPFRLISNRDRDNSFKIVKVCRKGITANRELQVLEYLRGKADDHKGEVCVRRACDSFRIVTSNSDHSCLVYEPLGINLMQRISLESDKRFDFQAVRAIACYLLLAIDYLHTAGVIHTGV